MLKPLIPFIFAAHLSFGQFIDNPSFEGKPGSSKSPEGWHACNNLSTPDTQPGSWNVALAAADGKTYISLVTRGINGDGGKDNTKEAIGIPFKIDFTIGVSYKISIDLAYAKNFDDLWYPPNWKPSVLKIYAGDSECEQKTLLWTSPTISNTDWVVYDFIYTPTQIYKYLILEANFENDIPHNGNILVDHIIISDSSHPTPTPDSILITSGACKLGIPNVFTPNSDGFNEKFVIQYHSNVARFNLRIYNRWGNLVFQNSNIDDVWDGRTQSDDEASPGIYYWIIDCLCIDNNTILGDTLKGAVTLIR